MLDPLLPTERASDAFDVVFITGTVPRADGVGIERRAAQTLRALSRLGRVHVLHVGPAASRPIVPESMRALCTSWQSRGSGRGVDVGRWLRRAYLRAPRLPAPPAPLRGWLEAMIPLEGSATGPCALPSALVSRARYVHVFRLGLLPLATPWFGRADVRVCVDVDDLESDTLAALAELAAREGETGLAWTFEAMFRAARSFEQTWLAHASTIAVCSEADRATLAARVAHTEVVVLPNVFALPRQPVTRQTDSKVTRLLFVGALGYYPNIDALRFFARDVLPRIRAQLPRQVELHVVGRGATRALRRALSRTPGIVWHGAVDDLAPLYARSDVALCPIRVGGGTRIKLLEAFAHGVPVVSTRAGAAGLTVSHGQQLLLADDAATFAEAVCSLASAPVAAELAERARTFVSERHGEVAFDRVVSELTR